MIHVDVFLADSRSDRRLQSHNIVDFCLSYGSSRRKLIIIQYHSSLLTLFLADSQRDMLQIRETGAFFSEITSATPVCRCWGWGKPSVLSFYRTAINSNIKALHYKDIMRSIEHILSFMARDYKIEKQIILFVLKLLRFSLFTHRRYVFYYNAKIINFC